MKIFIILKKTCDFFCFVFLDIHMESQALEEKIIRVIKERFSEILKENQDIKDFLKEIIENYYINDKLEKLYQEMLDLKFDSNQK